LRKSLIQYLFKLKTMEKNERRSKGISQVIVAIIITSMVVALGLFIYGFSLSWFNLSAGEAASDIGGLAAMVRSSLIVEAGNVTGNQTILRLRNIGEFPVIVTRIEVYKLSSSQNLTFVTSQPPSGFANITKVDPEEVEALTVPTCTTCNPGDIAVYKVTYLTRALFNPDHPEENAQHARVAEYYMAFTGTASRRCAIPPSNWIWMDISDPLQYLGDGQYGRLGNEYGVRFVKADTSTNVNVEVQIRELNGSKSYTSPVTTLKSQYYAIQDINMPNLYDKDIRPPFEVNITVQGWTVIQYRWVHGGSPSAFANTISVVWTEYDEMAHGVWVSVVASSSKTVTVHVTIKDCDGIVIATGSASEYVEKDNPENVYVEFNNPVNIWDLYEVEVDVT